MKTYSDTPIGQIVAEDFRAAEIFRSYGMDFCCGGKKSLKDSCAEKDIDYIHILEELTVLKNTGGSSHHYNEWDIDFLVDFIVRNHHKYIRNKLPDIAFYAEKVARVHGDKHPELNEILKLFRELSDELYHHIEEEEKGVFADIKDMVRNGKTESVKSSIIEALEDEHEKAGALMEEIERLTNQYNLPSDACASYTVLYQSLEAFQNDLHKHIHLENNILFPKALSVEARCN